jgi:hypothetical protein
MAPVTVTDPPGPSVTDYTSTSPGSCAMATGAKMADANIRETALKSANLFICSPFLGFVFLLSP